LFFGKHDHLFFDPACWWWPAVPPFCAYLAKVGRKWITKQVVLKKPIMHKWRNGNPPPPPPLGGISFGTNLRHKMNRPSSGRSTIMQLLLTSGMVNSQRRLTKVIPFAVLNWWNWWSTSSTVVPSLNIIWQPFAKKGNLNPWKSFSMLQCMLINHCAKHLYGVVKFGSS
jgi:hypothetical protein